MEWTGAQGLMALLPWVVNDKKYFIEKVADDLDRYHTRVVIIKGVDRGFMGHFSGIVAIKGLNERQAAGKVFDFIGYFSHNTKFKTAWSHYRYSTTIGPYHLYRRID
jgi:hypothetical protein